MHESEYIKWDAQDEVHIYPYPKSGISEHIVSEHYWSAFITDWQSTFGEINEQVKVIIHFEFCRWMEPLVTLSLILEINYLVEKNILIELRFQNFNEFNLLKKFNELNLLTESERIKQISFIVNQYKFLRFIAEQGFFETWMNQGIGIFFQNKISDLSSISDRIINTTSKYYTNYENSDLVQAEIITLPSLEENEGFPAEVTEKLLERIEFEIKDNIPSESSERIIYKLKLIIQESIHNVQEHAYREDEKKPLGIYLRYRTGGENISNNLQKNLFIKSVNNEKNRCFLLDNNWLQHRTGAIELFILDRGVGLLNSFKDLNRPSRKLRLQNIVRDTFCEGISSKTERVSAKGGLHLINEISTGDYFRVCCDKSWIGTSLPILSETKPIFKNKDYQAGFIGLGYHFRLSWKNNTDIGNSWFSINNSKNNHISHLNKLFSKNQNDVEIILSRIPYVVIDERFNNLTSNELTKLIERLSPNGYLIWSVKLGRMKWDIFKFLHTLLEGVKVKNIKLIINNIEPHEASTYEAAFADSSFKVSDASWPKYVSFIILVSQRFLFAKFDREYYLKNADEKDQKVEKVAFATDITYSSIKGVDDLIQENEEEGITLRSLIILLTKHHDSKLLWELINEYSEQNVFLNKKIHWNKDIPSIEGYLNFSSLSRIPIIRKLLIQSLTRYFWSLSIDESSTYLFTPLDRLVNTIVEEIKLGYIVNENNKNFTRKDVGIGSVYVSGQTESVVLPKYEYIHFFKHPDSNKYSKDNQDVNYLFYWFATNEPITDSEIYKKVGSSSSISKNGWKDIEIPRYKNGLLIGERSPEETYRDIQSISPIISKLGHWSYEGHHDFLTFNLRGLVEDGFAKCKTSDNPLFKYLIGSILGYLDINFTKDIRKEYQHIFNTSFIEEIENKYQNKGIVVYRSHLISELIISKVLGILKKETRIKLIGKVLPILPLRRQWGGSSFVISPIDKELINIKINEQTLSKRNVLIFDDACISGRTLLDVNSIVLSAGAKKVDVCVILDRMRLPSSEHAFNEYRYYWKIDLPPIGQDGNCPLCHSIDYFTGFKEQLSNPFYRETIDEWNLFWRKESPTSDWFKGLKPLPLNNKPYDKKYCFDTETDKHRQEISLTRTNGLITHVSELHAMTGADDYVIDRINRFERGVDESLEVKIELIVSQILLFSSEFSYKEIKLLLEKLIEYISKSKLESPYTGLAFIGFYTGVETINYRNKPEFVTALFKSYSIVVNEKITLLQALFVSNNLLKADDHIAANQLLGMKGAAFPLLLRELHASILTPKGNKHSRALTRYISLLENDYSDSFMSSINQTLPEVQNHFFRLKSIIESIHLMEARTIRDENVQKRCDELLCLLDESIDIIKIEVNDSNRTFIADSLKPLFYSLKGYAEFYKVDVKSNQPNFLEDITQNLKLIIDRVLTQSPNKTIELVDNSRFKSEPVNFENTPYYNVCWITWSKSIEQLLEDIFGNCVHIENKSLFSENNPFDTSTSHLWCAYHLVNEGLCIEFTNKLSGKAKAHKIYSKVEDKRRWGELTIMGGSVNMISTDNPLEFKMSVILPYVHKLTLNRD